MRIHLKLWLEAKIADGHTRDSLARQLNLSDQQLDSIEADPTCAPDAFFVSHDDFYDLSRKILAKDGKKVSDLDKSLIQWKEYLAADGASVLYHRWQDGIHDGFQFCFATKWQKRLSSEGIGKDIVCIDSTHNPSLWIGELVIVPFIPL